jgi:hypothetical protein
LNNDTSSKLTKNSKNDESLEREASPVVPVIKAKIGVMQHNEAVIADKIPAPISLLLHFIL